MAPGVIQALLIVLLCLLVASVLLSLSPGGMLALALLVVVLALVFGRGPGL